MNRVYSTEKKNQNEQKKPHKKTTNPLHTPLKDKFLANIRLENLFQSSFLLRYHCAHKNCYNPT